MILDTNSYTALKQNNPTLVDILAAANTLYVPLPVIGELRYGFQKGSQTKQNESELVRFLASPNVQVLSPTLQTSEHYAQIALVCQKQGRALSQNDIWIAAIAKENNAPLVTFDKDFAILQDFLSDRLIVLSHHQ